MVEPLAFAAGVPAVSAEMLQAAMAGIAQHSVAKTDANTGGLDNAAGQVSHVLSDSLAGGSEGKPDIDSLLHAISGVGHAQIDVAHALAAAGSMLHEPFGFQSGAHVLMPLIDEMAAHVAGVPPPA